MTKTSLWIFAMCAFLLMHFIHELVVLNKRGTFAALDIGQGDSLLLISKEGHVLMIDGGPDMSSLPEMANRLPFFRRKIDLLVLTHPNLDHLASLAEVSRRYEVRAVMLPFVSYPLPRYHEWLDELRAHNIAFIEAVRGTRVRLGSVNATVLWPAVPGGGPLVEEDVNNASTILRIESKNVSILTTGDAEDVVENEILKSGINLHADILKIGHHGSETSTTQEFLRAVNPQTAVISVGRDNDFGHPRQNILERLQRSGAEILRTDTMGTVALPL